MQTADDVIAALDALADPSDIDYVGRFFGGSDPENRIMGVRMPKVFPLAKRFAALPPDQIERLLEDDHYEVRMAAVSIMDFQARQKGLDPDLRKALYDLYLRRHDRINNWDLVDRAAPHVIGEHLVEQDRAILDKLARSEDPHTRRTALVATYAFIKRGEIADTFRIADILADDADTYVQKALGSWLREAGKRDEAALVAFIRKNRHRLPAKTITAASKRLATKDR